MARKYTRIKRDIRNYYKVNEKNGCWEWIRSLNGDGYPQWWDGKRAPKASRFLYEKLVGKIPEGLQLDHLCKNRACVNPEHLEPVTQTENTRRGLRTKLAMAEVNRIRELYSRKKYNQYELAAIYHVGQDQISRIINHRRWAT